jgi:hypothetical protein
VKVKINTALAIVGILACSVDSSRAAIISDQLTVFNPDGTIFVQVSATEDQEAALGAGNIYFLSGRGN